MSPQNPRCWVTAGDSTRGLCFYDDILGCGASFKQCDEQEAHQPLPFVATASHLAWVCLENLSRPLLASQCHVTVFSNIARSVFALIGQVGPVDVCTDSFSLAPLGLSAGHG